MARLTMIWFYCCALAIILKSTSAIDTMFQNQTLKEGETLVSEAEVFELGFFSLRNSTFRYLGIRYKRVSVGTVVWIANREVPLVDPTGVLKISDEGTLELLSVSNTLIWSSGSSKRVTNMNPVAQLLDSGNLVIRDDISSDIIWQSFDYPGDTWLPGMKIGVDLVTGMRRTLTSWKSLNDPSSGSYTVWMDINGYPQLYNMKDESNFQQRIGYWNGLGFTGMQSLGPNSFFAFDFVFTDEEIYCNYTVFNSSVVTRMVLDQQGSVRQYVWLARLQLWSVYMSLARDICDQYDLCGPYGSCNINNSPACACLPGFEPKLKLPDSRLSWFDSTMSLKDCGNLCARNVSCTAYANIDVRGGGSGCLQWSSELFDIRDASERDFSGQDIYREQNDLQGVLDEGGEIAVKRLSKTSRQGLAEFENEVKCIAKLQHRNLVKLLGYL